MDIKRVFLIVLDSYGIGNAPDAADFGDEGSNTLATIVKSEKYHTPNMCKLGLFNIDGVEAQPKEKEPSGAFGRFTEASKGKDTTIGHWEIAGIFHAALFLFIRMVFQKRCLTNLRAVQVVR